MSDDKPLINIDLGELSKPATVLVEKISNAVGVLYEPKRIVKRAEAEAKADKIKALASIELNEIEQRAIDRLVHQETRKQENIESITAQAIQSLDVDANVDELEEDWIAHFFKNCDIVSDKEMQSLWSRLLAGEATNSGTFSKRTIDLIASMSKSDAQLFTNFCQFCWNISGRMSLILDENDDIYKTNGVDFGGLKHLDAIGLISFDFASGYQSMKHNKYSQVDYFGTPVLIEFSKENDNTLKLGKALLTQAGKELAPISGAQKNEEFFEYVINRWTKQGLTVTKLQVQKTT